jgi:diguanylate cyclase (GGDEF)-like protein/PAS domain S-box-containing protein
MLDAHDEFRALFESAPDLLYTQDLTGRITRVNRAFERVTGYSKHEALQLNIADLAAPECRALATEHTIAAAGGAAAQAFELTFIAKDRSPIYVEVTTELIFREGRPAGIQAYARDVSEKRLQNEARARAEAGLARFTRDLELIHRLSTTHYGTLDALFGSYLAAGCGIFGVPNGAVVERRAGSPHIRSVHGARPPAAILDVAHCLSAPILVNETTFGDIVFWSGEAPLDEPHPQANTLIELMARAIGVALHQRQLTDQLALQASRDALTGLPNRVLLTERLTAALDSAQASGTQLAVAFIDLDRFKQINDSLGHAVGDCVLQQIASRLGACVETSDTLARMGGDEFTAILTGIRDRNDAVAIARRLLAAVRSPCRVDEYELFVTASIGICFFPGDGADATTLLRNADAAMYSAKYRGRNDVHCYQAEVTAVAIQRLNLETQLRHALERNELRMFYQSQVTPAGDLAGVEVLLGWEHPELGHISPLRFIPIAEETGMILPIGSWVLRNACRRMSRWHETFGIGVPVAVNVSALQFAQANFVSVVADTLNETGLPANCLELELTESLLVRDVDLSTSIMRELRELGVRIAIDDFGTGYSSLSYLRRLPADILKIDQSFLVEIEDDRCASALVQAIAVLGHTFGLTVTAEGVETARQLDCVRNAGCDRIQGHLFGGALSPEDIEQLLAKRPHSAGA